MKNFHGLQKKFINFLKVFKDTIKLFIDIMAVIPADRI